MASLPPLCYMHARAGRPGREEGTSMVTRDRAEVLHFAGFHHLSPALGGGGEPAFSSGAGDGLARCGWEPFFAALSARRLAVAFERDDASSVRFVPASEREDHPSAESATEHARRFWTAWRGKS